ncbi:MULTISPECIES: Rieske (2Fe-2S) protein [unclassified Streptomyces]|uniref:Rieske (2Fe-2S) protein n=1 Tax=unclassified Streptomyces TaxID=2593676 RepID=UPI0007F4C703|nr:MULTISPECIES: Rieske (2Fe-2S) protein [unclassified Streptomyces]MCM1972786.1 Rieske (2Fe-2S) protein [Streptomyces sp. G1]SBT90581.1 Ferredoxin subunit of nitrite reductase or a ring-hydroxylating dioxygenase [Streptomyces sp. DI166]
MTGHSTPSRRTVLRGAALAPVAGLGLAACSPGGETVDAEPTAPVDLGAEGEVAKGGAKLYKDHNVVVSRDDKGALKAYSTICTHARCPINTLDGTKLVCSCHGSEFDATNGEVLREPASVPLKELPVEAKDGRIVVSPATDA